LCFFNDTLRFKTNYDGQINWKLGPNLSIMLGAVVERLWIENASLALHRRRWHAPKQAKTFAERLISSEIRFDLIAELDHERNTDKVPARMSPCPPHLLFDPGVSHWRVTVPSEMISLVPFLTITTLPKLEQISFKGVSIEKPKALQRRSYSFLLGVRTARL
jgi:hypothetical protein